MSNDSCLRNEALILATGQDFPVIFFRRDAELSEQEAIHRHEDFELRLIFTEDMKKPERLDVIFPHICHRSLKQTENSRAVTLIFAGGTFLCRCREQKPVRLYSTYSTVCLENIRQFSQQIDRLEIRLLLALLLIKAEPLPENSSATEKLQSVLQYMDQYYYRQDLTISSIAEMAGYSPKYLQQIFRLAAGCNPKEYLLRIRLTMAAKFLLEKRYLVKEIASLCGFSDSHYFSNVFRKHYGCSPGSYDSAPEKSSHSAACSATAYGK